MRMHVTLLTYLVNSGGTQHYVAAKRARVRANAKNALKKRGPNTASAYMAAPWCHIQCMKLKLTTNRQQIMLNKAQQCLSLKKLKFANVAIWASQNRQLIGAFSNLDYLYFWTIQVLCTAEDGIAKNSTYIILHSTKTLRSRIKLHNELKLIEREAVKARIKCLCNELPFAQSSTPLSFHG